MLFNYSVSVTEVIQRRMNSDNEVRGCNQKSPDWVDKEINNNQHSLRSNTKGYGGKTHRMTHKIAIQLHLMA